MHKIRFALKVFTLTTFVLAFAAVANAQATRTWVSGVGDDVNPCSRTAPCKTFAGAISKTATGGEISVLDPGGYGTLTVTKAITVDGGTGAGWGSVLSSGLSGFTINITTNLTSDKVILRNLSINGNNSVGGFHGIRFLDGAELVVENVDIFNFTGSGIFISQAQTSKTAIDNVRIDNTANGVTATTTIGDCVVMANNLKVHKFTTNGVTATANVRMSLRDSVIAHGTTGLSTTGANSVINADSIYVTGCGTGVSGAGAGSSINVSDSVIAQNTNGVTGVVNSFQGNSLIANTTPGAFVNTTNKQ
ncbi:MAG: hypothetical protein AABN95_16720 [Acidobacteriota bacterium]